MSAFGLLWSVAAFAGGSEPAEALLEALADPDASQLAAFVGAHFSASALADFSARAWARSLSIAARESGGFDALRLDANADDVSIKGRTRVGDVPIAGHIWLDHKELGKIRGLQLTRDLVGRPADAPVWPERAVGDRAIKAAIEAEIGWRAATDRFSGVVLVAHRDDVVVERAVGWADAAHSRQNEASERFALASLGKMFTAVAVAQLIEAGAFLLDEPIDRLLPSYPNPLLARRITPRQLLGHTSGLGDLPLEAPGVWHDFEHGAGPTEMLHHLARVRQEFSPGVGYHYSNAGFLVLGALIEAFSGEGYADRIRTRVFLPSGMGDALFPSPGRLPDRAAEGLTFKPEDPLGFQPRIGNGVTVPIFSGPAGGAYATAADLFHFMRALQDGRLISAGTLKRLTDGLSPTWDRLGLYALGFIERRTAAGRMFGHAGGAASVGVNDVVWASDDGAWTVVVLSNYDAPVAVDLGTSIMDFVLRQEPETSSR